MSYDVRVVTPLRSHISIQIEDMSDNDVSGGPRQNHPTKLIISFLGEVTGTAILLYVGCMGCVLQGTKEVGHVATIVPGVTFGMAVAMAITIVGPISGCHINPAVSLGTLICGRITIIKFIVYIAAQYVGALIGFGMLFANFSSTKVEGPGICFLTVSIDAVAGFFVEVCVTCVLVLVVASVTDKGCKTGDDSLSIRLGFYIMGFVIASGPFTGASLNPARALAPSIYYMNFKDHWVFHAGPYAGGLLGGIIYRFLFDSETGGVFQKTETDTADKDILPNLMDVKL